MGYELHIRRQSRKITKPQWQQAVQQLPQLRLGQNNTAELQISGQWLEVFWYAGGEVTFGAGAYLRAALQQALLLAQRLDAMVVGDEGVTYTSVEQLDVDHDPTPHNAGAEKKIQLALKHQVNALDLRYLDMQALPASLKQLPDLVELSVFDNQLTKLPAWLGDFRQLQVLKLASNQLTTLPAELGQLTALRRLDLSQNQLKALPTSIGTLGSLRELNLRGNALAALPDSIGELTALEELNLNDNPLPALPESFGNLTKLTKFIGSGALQTLPDSIGQLRNLRVLDLSHNQLRSLPRSLLDLKLEQLFLHGNDKLGIPHNILGPDFTDLIYDNDDGTPRRPADPQAILAWYFKLPTTNKAATPTKAAKPTPTQSTKKTPSTKAKSPVKQQAKQKAVTVKKAQASSRKQATKRKKA